MLEWERHFCELMQFKERFGHCNVPAHSDRHRALGTWVYNQRVLKRKGKLDGERQLRLESEGFMWYVQRCKRGGGRGRGRLREWRSGSGGIRTMNGMRGIGICWSTG